MNTQDKEMECKRCNGLGYIIVQKHPGGLFRNVRTCPTCHGNKKLAQEAK